MIILADADAQRIDRFLSEKFTEHTRSHLQKLVAEGCVKVNSATVKPGYKVKSGDEIEITFPPPVELDVKAENIALNIVYEDAEMLVVNKPQGMVVHPAAGNYEGTLVNALLHHCRGSLSGINGMMRPGILHRIDKDTSGLLLVAKSDRAHNSLAAQIKEHSLVRKYKALVHGNLKEESGTVNAPLGRHLTERKKMTVTQRNAKEAVTHWGVIKRFKRYTLVECTLETGRTHQIRVHMASIGTPVVGDKTYGVKKEEFSLAGQLLHAYKVGFVHPITQKYMEFESELPGYFMKILDILEKKSGQ